MIPQPNKKGAVILTAVESAPAVISALSTGAAKEALGNAVDKTTADSQDTAIQKTDYAKVSSILLMKFSNLSCVVSTHLGKNWKPRRKVGFNTCWF